MQKYAGKNMGFLMRKFGNGLGNQVAVLSASKIITYSIQILTIMMISRYQTLEEYGTYSQISTVVSLSVTFCMLGLPYCITYFYPKAENDYEKDRFISNYLCLSTIFSVVMGAILCLSNGMISNYFSNPLISNYWYILLVLPWTRAFIKSVSDMLISAGYRIKLVVFSIANSIFLMGAIVITIAMRLGFTEYLIIYTIVEVLFTIISYINIIAIIKNKFCPNLRETRHILLYSIPLGLANVVAVLGVDIDKFVIGYVRDANAVAIYSNCGRELPFTIISASFTAIITPKVVAYIAKNKNQEAISLWSDVVDLSFIIICFCTTAMIAYSKQVIALLYSDKYLAGNLVFIIYAIVMLFRVTSFGIILNANGNTRTTLLCCIISLLINIIFSFPAYYIFGFAGPALVTLLSVIAMQAIQLLITAKNTCTSFLRIFKWKSMMVTVFVNICVYIVSVVLIDILNIGIDTESIIKAIIIGLIVTLIYVVIQFKRFKIKYRKINDYK